MTKTEKEMMNNLNGLEEIEKDEDLNLSEWVKVTTNYDDFFKHETISNIEDQAAMDEENIPSKININSSPEDRWCDCCGRHVSKLTPFGKAGDPLVGDFDGALLVKKYRRAGPYNEQAETAFKRVEEIMEEEGHAGEDPEEWMIKKYGKEKGQQYLNAVYAYGCIGSSRECRDYIVLDEDEYFEMLEKTYSS
jgi:hypothetical protein